MLLRILVQSTGAPRRRKGADDDAIKYSRARRSNNETMSARERLERQREYDDTAEERRESKRELRGRGIVRREEEEEVLQWLLDLSRRWKRWESLRQIARVSLCWVLYNSPCHKECASRHTGTHLL